MPRRIDTGTTTGARRARTVEPRIPARVAAFCRPAIEAGDARALVALADQYGLTDQAAELVAFLLDGGELRRWPYGRRGTSYEEHIANGGLPPAPTTEATR